MNVLTAALAAYDNGLCPIRASTSGTKAPLGKWKQWQTERPPRDTIETWFSNGHPGWGIICGQTSSNVEMVELEGRAIAEGIGDQVNAAMDRAGLADLWDSVIDGYLERTPSGGIHVLWRCTEIDSNLKLARRHATPAELVEDPDDRIKVLIETRGEGGFTILAPSNGTTHPTGGCWELVAGGFDQIATITPTERAALLAVLRSFDQIEHEPAQPANKPPTAPPDRSRPGDEFDAAHTGQQVFEAAGFTHHHTDSDGDHYTRPGKNPRHGSSGIVWADNGRCTLFSTSIDAPPEYIGDRNLTPWQLHVALNHNGRHGEAARHWRQTNPRFYADLTWIDQPQPALPLVDQTVENDFWDARPELAHIRTYAQSKIASPWSVLGGILARIVCQVPVAVVLPDIIYDHASLNIAIALVGASGGGKGGSTGVARRTLDIGTPNFDTHTLGSGQGIAHGYGHWEKPSKDEPGGIVRHADSVLFTIEEVDHLGAHANQNASTTLAELRRFVMGEKLGHLYVDVQKRVQIAAHTYRGAVLVSVQPARAAALLGDADGGTPQRFLWLPTTDPHPPDTEPETPTALTWRLPTQLPTVDTYSGYRPIPVCDTAITAIRQAQRDRNAGNGDPLDGHALLTRERIAAALGLLNGHYGVTEHDWDLAGNVMAVSDATRTAVAAALAEQARAANETRGRLEADREGIREEQQDARVARRLVSHLRAHGDWMAHNKLRGKLAGRDRQAFDSAIRKAVEAGQIEAQETTQKTIYRSTL